MTTDADMGCSSLPHPKLEGCGHTAGQYFCSSTATLFARYWRHHDSEDARNQPSARGSGICPSRVQTIGRSRLRAIRRWLLGMAKRPRGNAQTPMQHVRESFRRQGFMRSIGAVLESVESGTVTISCGADDGLTQQHGLIHGGVIASLADVACGYAALSLMPENKEVLTVEFKVNFLKPANTDRAIAVATVVQAGRTLTVCEATVFDDSQKLIAKMTATMMAVDSETKTR